MDGSRENVSNTNAEKLKQTEEKPDENVSIRFHLLIASDCACVHGKVVAVEVKRVKAVVVVVVVAVVTRKRRIQQGKACKAEREREWKRRNDNGPGSLKPNRSETGQEIKEIDPKKADKEGSTKNEMEIVFACAER